MSYLLTDRCKFFGHLSLGQFAIIITILLAGALSAPAQSATETEAQTQLTAPASATLPGTTAPTPGGSETTATRTATATETNEAVDPAEQYCKEKGGGVVERYPAYNTFATQPYDDPSRVVLAGSRKYCNFRYSIGGMQSAEIALDSLYTDQPTLAVLAYLKPLPTGYAINEDPATTYCSEMGGTDRWLAALAWQGLGGTWMWDPSPYPITGGPTPEMGMCVFPDLSAIDTNTLFDKAQGIIDGTDFGKIARYQPNKLPKIFDWPTMHATETESGSETTSTPTAIATEETNEAVDPAEQYCTDNGGYVTTRRPFYRIPSPDPWITKLELAGSLKTCTFVLPSGKRFEFALNTLFATDPTLAILAYYAPPSLPTGYPDANPATDYCIRIGGTTRWGGIDEQGGWARNPLVGPLSLILPEISSMCVFPDLSAIEEWALRDRAANAFSSADLVAVTSVLRYGPHPPIVKAGPPQRPWRPLHP